MSCGSHTSNLKHRVAPAHHRAWHIRGAETSSLAGLVGRRRILSVTEPCHGPLLSSRDIASWFAWLALGKHVAASSATAFPISSVVVKLAMSRSAAPEDTR